MLSKILESVTFQQVQSTFGDDDGLGDMGQDLADTYGAFGERLVAAADAMYPPAEEAIERCLRLVGGLQTKKTMRALAATLAAYAKSLAGSCCLFACSLACFAASWLSGFLPICLGFTWLTIL